MENPLCHFKSFYISIHRNVKHGGKYPEQFNLIFNLFKFCIKIWNHLKNTFQKSFEMRLFERSTRVIFKLLDSIHFSSLFSSGLTYLSSSFKFVCLANNMNWKRVEKFKLNKMKKNCPLFKSFVIFPNSSEIWYGIRSY